MVRNKTLSFIDTRLQQLTETKAVFGCLSVIAVGDLYQLKPTGDKLIRLNLEMGAASLARTLWKEIFTMFELVDIMRQKADLDFAHLLNRLRLNEMMKWQRKTKEKLQTRIVDRDTGDYPMDDLHLFAEHKFVNEHNNKILSQMASEKVGIPCHDTVVSANIPAKECQNLIYKLPDDYSKTGHLMKPLTLVVGMAVVMTVNEDGLTNGATGVVKHIDYRMEGTNRPNIIWVLFDDPRIVGQHERNTERYTTQVSKENGHLYLMYNEHLNKTYQRIQFPLTSASEKKPQKNKTKTVYKAEATVDEVVVDLFQDKKIRKIPHIHSVAVRIVRKLENLYFEPEWSCYGFRRTSDFRDA